MKPIIKILFVEDSPSDFELIKREIKKSGIEFVDQLVESKEAYKEALLSFKPDIILSDYSLPQFDGMQALEIRQKEAPNTPFILVTGALNEETAVEIMKAGSDDYIIKQSLTRLVPAIKSAIEKWEIIKAKKQAEKALKESEQKFKDLANLLPQVIYEMDLSGNLTYVNSQGFELFKYSREELEKGINVMQIIAPEDRERAKDTIHTILSGNEDFGDSEYTGLKKDGSVFPMLSFANVILKENIPVGLRGVVVDITDLKLTEEALQRSEQQYRRFFEKDISGIYLSTPQGKMLDCNPAFAKMLGYSIDEMFALDTTSLYPYLTNRNEFLHKLTTKKNLVDAEIDLVHKDGQIIHCIENVVGIFNDEGELEQFQGYLADITERKKAENALKESEHNYRSIFEGVADGIIHLDNDIKVINVNPAFEQITGISKEQVIGKSGIKLAKRFVNFRQLPNVLSIVKNIVSEKSIQPFKLNYSDKILEISTHRQVGGANIGIIRDVTERHQAEKALKESELKYRSLFEKSADALLIIDDGKFVDCNPATVKMLGYTSRKEIINIHPAKLSPDLQADGRDSIEKANEMMAIAYEKGSHRFEWLHRRQNDEVFPAEVLLTSIPIGDKPFLHVVWRDITDRKIAEKALRESEEKYKSLFDTANDAIFVMKNDVFIACNQKTLEMFGCAEDEIIGYSPIMYSPDYQPDGVPSKEKADNKIKEALSGKPQFFEWTHQRKNGTPFAAEVSLNRMLLSDGEYIHAIVRNIDDRILAEKALKENEESLSTLISNMPGMAYLGIDDEHWTMLYINGACEKITGYKPRQLINNKEVSFAEIIHPDDKQHVRKQITLDPSIGEHFEIEYRIITAKGAVKWVWERGIHRPAPDGRTTLTEGVIDDITERVLSKNKLIESEEKYHSMIINLMEGFFSATFDGKLTEYNTELIKIFGLDPKNNYLGLELPDFWLHPEARKDYIRQFMEKGFVKDYIVEIKKQDGSKAIVQINSRLIKDESGNPYKIEGTLLDITERIHAVDLLKQSEIQLRNLTAYMDKKTENEKKIIAKEIHDGLGQLLTGLKMDLQWINKKYPKESAVLKHKLTAMNNIIDSAVTDVQKLTFSLRPKMLDELGLIETIQSEAEHFAERTGISCSVWFNPETFDVEYNSSSAIYRIMMELLTNIYRHANASEVEIKLEKIKNKCIFTITDNGIGISQDQIDSRNSFGLISITERANVLNGSIKIQGKLNIGTTVRVVIPL